MVSTRAILSSAVKLSLRSLLVSAMALEYLSNRPVRPVCDPTATLLRCNFQKRSGVAENCQKILKSMRQVAHSTLLTRSPRSHCAPTTLYAISLRPRRPRYDLATTSLRPYYALTTSPLRSVRLYHVRAATINTARSTAGDQYTQGRSSSSISLYIFIFITQERSYYLSSSSSYHTRERTLSLHHHAKESPERPKQRPRVS